MMDISSSARQNENSITAGNASFSKGRRQLLLLGLFPLSEHIAWSSIFPYIYAMVKSMGRSTDPEGHKTAFYASLLVSFFTFGEFLMAPQWARISDRIGRKPTLLIGSLGAVFSALVFGLSTSLPMAFVARLCAGMLNPNLGVLKTYVGELLSKDKQARGFSTISFMQSLGSICGPIVGGYLAEPTRKFPTLFPPGSMWDKYPYLLPNLLTVVCLSSSCIFGLLFLQEVHPNFRHRDDIAQKICSKLSAWIRGRGRSLGEVEYTPVNLDDADFAEEEVLSEQKINPHAIKYRDAFTKQVILQIVSITFRGYQGIATIALVPIFLGSPQPSTVGTGKRTMGGGFGLNTENTSSVLLTQAIATILCQAFLIPQLIEKIGPLRSFRISLSLWIILYVLMPFSVILPGFTGLLAFMALLWIQAFLGGTSGTATSMMLTNNAPSPIYLATINGVAASCGCLAKTAGPATVGALYEIGTGAGNIGIPFWILGLVALLTLGLSLFLREQIDSDD